MHPEQFEIQVFSFSGEHIEDIAVWSTGVGTEEGAKRALQDPEITKVQVCTANCKHFPDRTLYPILTTPKGHSKVYACVELNGEWVRLDKLHNALELASIFLEDK